MNVLKPREARRIKLKGYRSRCERRDVMLYIPLHGAQNAGHGDSGGVCSALEDATVGCMTETDYCSVIAIWSPKIIQDRRKFVRVGRTSRGNWMLSVLLRVSDAGCT